MQKYFKYIAAGGVVVVFIIVAIYSRNKMSSGNDKSGQENTSPTTTSVNTTSTTNATGTQSAAKSAVNTTPKTAVIKKPVVTKSAPQSYVDAAAKYKKSGYYIQFYPCQATPGSLIVKQGSKIMLDNRDSKAHSIGIKNDKYLIASYNYAIATLNSIGTNYVTCDGGGSATVTVVP